jgi:streptogrisin C
MRRRSIPCTLALSAILLTGLAVPAGAVEPLTGDTDLAKLGAAQKSLSTRLGAPFGGSWLDPATGAFTVGVTDPALSRVVSAIGAVPKVVKHSAAELAAVQSDLDNRASVQETVTGWHVDHVRNTVIVTVHGDDAAGTLLAGTSGLIQVERSAHPVRPLWNIIGGQSISLPPYVCSAGFNARGGGERYVITAGHCTDVGNDIGGVGGELGEVAGTSFPGNDYGIIRVTSDNAKSTARVSRHDHGDDVFVAGTEVVPVNGRICRSGQTTGWHCGVVTAVNQTVNYGDGDIVRGLTQTTACAEGGDSGGPYVSAPPSQRRVHAQGVLSGGSGDCSEGGVTFFQPVREILDNYDLRLYIDG